MRSSEAMSQIMRCKNCEGKGHVADGGMVLPSILMPWFLPCWFLDRNNKSGTTRADCSHCKGTGFVVAPALPSASELCDYVIGTS